MAAEAARIAHMSNVIRMRTPGHLHVWKNVGREDIDQPIAGRFYEIGMLCENLGVLVAVELRELLGNLLLRFGFSLVISLQQRETFLMDPGKIGADRALGHRPVKCVFSRLHRVRSTVVAIDAVHHATLTLWHGTF